MVRTARSLSKKNTGVKFTSGPSQVCIGLLGGGGPGGGGVFPGDSSKKLKQDDIEKLKQEKDYSSGAVVSS